MWRNDLSSLLVGVQNVTTALENSLSSVHSVMSDFATPWTAARQVSLSITKSRSSPKPVSIESVVPFNHLILCRPLLLLPSNLPSIRVLPHSTAQKGGSGRETFNTKPVKLGLNHSLSHPHTHAPSKVLHLLPQLRTVG